MSIDFFISLDVFTVKVVFPTALAVTIPFSSIFAISGFFDSKVNSLLAVSG